MSNPRRLVRLIQKALTPDLLSPAQRAILRGAHPTEGHCAVAAEAAYHMLGGKAAGWVPKVLPKNVLGHTTHWWIENKVTGERIDPTAEQFPFKVPYEKGRGCGFQCPTGGPSKRAMKVICAVKNEKARP